MLCLPKDASTERYFYYVPLPTYDISVLDILFLESSTYIAGLRPPLSVGKVIHSLIHDFLFGRVPVLHQLGNLEVSSAPYDGRST